MQNADKPPTPEWLNTFFSQFPWVDGITGLNSEGGIVGHAGRAEKKLDFGSLLESDPKQCLHALRGDVQDSDSGPEVLLAVPLHDGPDFLGLVVANFEMRSLMQHSDARESLIITSPGGQLWSGSSAGTMPNVDWRAITRSRTNGTISDGSGTYQWVSRFLGNYPLVFAVRKTASGTAPEKAETASASREASYSVDENAPSASSDAAPASTDKLDPETPPLPEL
jgi:hypothetical protein